MIDLARFLLIEAWLRIVEFFCCWIWRGRHRYRFDAIGIARCRSCKREAIEGLGELRRGWR